MRKKRFGVEQIVTFVRRIEVAMGQGKSAQIACREAGISNRVFGVWRRDGGLRVEQAKRMKERKK